MCSGVACILNKMQRPEVVVGVDGSLYRFHPNFHNLMMEMTKILAPGIQVDDISLKKKLFSHSKKSLHRLND